MSNSMRLLVPLVIALAAAGAPAAAQRSICPPPRPLRTRADSVRADTARRQAIAAGRRTSMREVPRPRLFCGLGLPAAVQSEQPMMLEVVDDMNRPIPGARIAFKPDVGCGTAVVDTAVTNSAGRVRLSWKMGTKSGVCSAVTQVVGSARFPRVITVVTTNGPAHRLRVVRGGQQSAKYGALLPDFIEVEARDRYGNIARNALLRFSVKSGGGRIVDYAAVPALNRNTNLRGLARVVWRLGPRGVQQLEVTPLDVPDPRPLVIPAAGVP